MQKMLFSKWRRPYQDGKLGTDIEENHGKEYLTCNKTVPVYKIVKGV